MESIVREKLLFKKGRGFPFSSPIEISVFGGLTILVSLLFYESVLSNLPVQTSNIEFLQLTAYFVLGCLLLGLFMALGGATIHLTRMQWKNRASISLTAMSLSLALNDKRSFRIFVVSSLIYGILFGFLSSFVAYRPFGIFSDNYAATIPSANAVVCCGPLGQMPQFVIYLSRQFALLVIPENLILLVVVSWLVGLNAGIAAFAYKNRPRTVSGRWVVGLGATVGLFTACPSCAGFFLLTMLGLTGAVGLALTLSSLQAVFIAVGLPILLAAPILAARGIGSNAECFIQDRISRDSTSKGLNAPSATS